LRRQQPKGEAVGRQLSYTDYIDVAARANKLGMEFAKTGQRKSRSKTQQYQTVDLYGKESVKKQT
jgi:hypothetical protein